MTWAKGDQFRVRKAMTLVINGHLEELSPGTILTYCGCVKIPDVGFVRIFRREDYQRGVTNRLLQLEYTLELLTKAKE